MTYIIFIRSALVLVALLIVSGCSAAPSSDLQSKSEQKTSTLTASQKLGTVSPEFISLSQDTTRPQGVHDSLVEVATGGIGFAYIESVSKGFRVVHNGRAGKPYQLVGDLTISKDGTRVAYVAHINDKFKSIIVDGVGGALFTDIGMPQFSPDGKHLVYTVTLNNEERIVIDNKVHHNYQVVQDMLISPDSRYIAFTATAPVSGQKQFIVSDLLLQDRKVFESCGEEFVGSEDRSRIAVVCSEGRSRTIKILDFKSRLVVTTLEVPAAGSIVHKRFAADNRSFVYTTMTDDYQRFVHYNGRTEKIPKGDEIMTGPLVLTEPERVGTIIGNAFDVRFHTAFQKSGNTEKHYGYVSDFIASADGRHHAYVAIKAGGEERMRIVIDGNEGPLYDKIVSPVFAPDGRFLVFRARQGGKRFLVVSDLKGKVVRQHKEYSMVFQPVFSADGTSVAYGVVDGTDVWWKVEKF